MNKILEDLRQDNNFAFGELYKQHFSKISRFVQNNGGTAADAEDLFQDAMLVLVPKLQQEAFRLTASIGTYVYAICKNLWFKKLRGKQIELSYDLLESETFQASIDSSIDEERDYVEKIQYYLSKITDHCKRLLQDMFFKGKQVKEIQASYGYSSSRNVHNQKYKCVEQIRRVKEAEKKV